MRSRCGVLSAVRLAFEFGAGATPGRAGGFGLFVLRFCYVVVITNYNQDMPENRFRFRIVDLLLVTTYIALVVTGVVYLPTLYETEGDIGEAFIGLLFVLFMVVTTVCLCFRRLRIAALVVSLIVCGLFIYRQAMLTERLRQLELEVARIITYVEGFKVAHGSFPANLSGYEFERPALQEYVVYTSPNPRAWPLGTYEIRYHPYRIDGIAHWYSSSTGYWFEDD